MTDFENFKECWKKTESYKLNENVMKEEFGEDITRVMNCEKPKERFIATLYLNDCLLEKITEQEAELEKLEEENEYLKEDCEIAKETLDELKEIKSFLAEMMKTDAYFTYEKKCDEIINKYYYGNISEWEKLNGNKADRQ